MTGKPIDSSTSGMNTEGEEAYAMPRADASEEVLSDSQDAVLVEVICERYHCVMYDYAITTVEFVAEDFEDAVRVKPVVRRGNRENAERFFELCRLNGRHLSVPTILIDGKVVFTDVPAPEELREAIKRALDERRSV